MNKLFYQKVAVILFIVITCIITISYSFCNYEKKKMSINEIVSRENKNIIPTLILPIKYFDKDLIQGGTWKNNNSNGDSVYSSARIDEGARSVPTTTISLNSNSYDQKKSELPLIKKDENIFIMEDDIGHDGFRENIKLYGDLARRFLPEKRIVNIEKIDVDEDGLNETVISTCDLWGNGCPHNIVIVKNNKIIFQTNNRGIISSKTNNGFYLKWEKTYNDPVGYMLTRFVFENGEFKPVYEQEVLYLRVEDPLY